MSTIRRTEEKLSKVSRPKGAVCLRQDPILPQGHPLAVGGGQRRGQPLVHPLGTAPRQQALARCWPLEATTCRPVCLMHSACRGRLTQGRRVQAHDPTLSSFRSHVSSWCLTRERSGPAGEGSGSRGFACHRPEGVLTFQIPRQEGDADHSPWSDSSTVACNRRYRTEPRSK